MKTKLEMAHEWYMMQTRRNGCALVADAWKYADAMQAAADEREKKTNCDSSAKFDMYLEYDASINYPPDAWVMYKGEKRLAVSIDTEKEWQPDWSQAHDWAKYFTIDSLGIARFWDYEPTKTSASWFIDDDVVWRCEETTIFNYKGDWRNSLRKRPQ